MQRQGSRPSSSGSVVFIGAGPGDPGLLALRAVEALADADIILLEHAEQEALLRVVQRESPPKVEVVGHDDAGLPLTVAARSKAVVQQARAGHRVARVLTGDPFLDSTGVAEAAACRKAGIGFEVVPGVAQVTGSAAYAGVSLHAGGGLIVLDLRSTPLGGRVAADCLAGLPTPAGNRGGAARSGASRSGGPRVCVVGEPDALTVAASRLVELGWPTDQPVRLIRGGATLEQLTVSAGLGAVSEGHLLEDASMLVLDPALATSNGADEYGPAAPLAWFETKPLFGWRVLVPRTREQAGSMSRRLLRYGAVAEEVPTIAVEPPRNPRQMEKALRGLVEGNYEWIAFTSSNALRAVRRGIEAHGLDARALSGLKVAAVGERTAQALRDWGIEPDLVPSGEQSSHGLLADWPPYDEDLDPINRVFLPRADIATETLAAGLVELGWEADDVTAYRTVRAAPPAASIRDAIKTGGFDAVVFTSSSTIRNLVGIAGKPHPATVVACIGPQTAKTAEEFGLRVDVLAPTPSVEVLTDALADFGARRRQEALDAGEPLTRPSERRRTPQRRSKSSRHAT